MASESGGQFEGFLDWLRAEWFPLLVGFLIGAGALALKTTL